MVILIYVLLALIGLLAIIAISHLVVELKVVNRLVEVNKQLLIVVAGKEAKPEALRALVASARQPKKNLPGISGPKKDDKGPKNTNYTLEIGA